MFRSMTAYGRSLTNASLCEVSVELISLNRKHLEIRFHLPTELSRFEPYLRSLFDKKVERGMINVKIQVKWNDQLPLDITSNLPLIKKYIEMRQRVEKDLNMRSDPSALIDWAFKQEGVVLAFEDEKKDTLIKEILNDAIIKAFEPFFEMKEKEGYTLLTDVSSRLNNLEPRIQEITAKAPDVVRRYREKIEKVLKDFEINSEDKERLIKEVALFADRIDITEELTRFNSHLKQLITLISSKAIFIGKTIDFLIQEMMREVNTIGNKAQDHEVSSIVVTIKAELEKIREQIQNVE